METNNMFEDLVEILEETDNYNKESDSEVSNTESVKNTEDTEETENTKEADNTEDVESINDVESEVEEEDAKGNKETYDSKEALQNKEASVLETVYETLKEKGLLIVDDAFKYDNTPESLEQAIASTVENLPALGAKLLLEKLPEQVKGVLDFAIRGGTDLSSYFKATYQTSDLKNLDPEKLEDRREIMYRYYKATTKYDDVKIERLVDKLEKDPDFAEEVFQTYTELKDIYAEQAEKAIQEEKIKNEESIKSADLFRSAISTTLDSRVPDADKRNKLRSFILNSVSDNNGTASLFVRVINSISSNPEHLVQLATLLMDSYDAKDGFNFSTLERRVESNKVRTLREKLEAPSSDSKKRVGAAKDSKSNNFDWSLFLQ